MMIDLKKDIESILGSIEGFLLIDTKEQLLFMSQDLLDTIGVESFAAIRGHKLRDVISSNTTYKVLKTGKPQIAEAYLVQGYIIISNAYPIYKDGELIGALEYDVFQGIDTLEGFFDKISSKTDLKLITDALSSDKRGKYSLANIRGSSNAIKKMKSEIKLASRSNSTVLISGETGTGKELIAHAIHYAGHRAIFDFLEVNCATIPSELFESELYGYEEGSFTGAKKGGKKGLAELADQGTLFLDEVNALPMAMQAKLLRFLQEKEIQKVGGGKPISVDLRIIAATNKSLADMVEEGTFRQDLFYRLNVIEIKAEPLRNRKSDIPELVNSFIDELNSSLLRNLESQQVRDIESEALKLLMNYDWPGNVRELHNVIERAMNRCYEPTLRVEHFADIIKNNVSAAYISEDDMETMSLKDLTRKVEALVIHELLVNRGLTKTQAAKKLGISRQMLHRKIKEQLPSSSPE